MWKKLTSIARSNIKFIGMQSDDVTKEYYARCKAFIRPSEEDFGITPLESQSCGRPAIAYGRGGVLETIIPGKTGEFFSEQTPESLKEVIKKFGMAKINIKIKLQAVFTLLEFKLRIL